MSAIRVNPGSVGFRLLLAFILMAMLPAIAAVGGWTIHIRISEQQTATEQRSLPFALDALRLSETSSHLTAALAPLARIENMAQLDVLGETLKRRAAQLNVRLDRLSRYQLAPNDLIAAQQASLSDLQGNLKRFLALTSERLSLSRKLDDAVERGRSLTAAVDDVVKPLSIAAFGDELDKIDALTEHIAAARPANVLSESLDQLTRRSVYSEVLAEFSFRSNTIEHIINQLANAGQVDAIAALAAGYGLQVRAMTRLVLDVEDEVKRAALADQLAELVTLGNGSEGLFALRTAVIDADRDLLTLDRANRDIDHRLSDIANRFAQLAETAIADASRASANILTLQRNTLIGLALLALLMTLIVGFYVRYAIVDRLSLLAQTTQRLSAGELDITIDQRGHDELSAMAKALAVFKHNALALRANVEALARANDELNQFAYIASHDLRSPLRGIDQLAAFLEEDLAATLADDPDSRDSLRLIRSRVKRLDRLLNDLLQYSRATQYQAVPETVDSAALVRESFDLLGPGPKAKLVIDGDMPVFDTVKTPLAQIIRNLIDNALKHHDRDVATITVSCVELADRYQFSVSDDGPGIAPAFQERIFGMFQTLKSRDKLESSGMGLAVLRKILSTLNCSITVTSDPERTRGSTFRFDWPKQDSWPTLCH